MKVLDNCHSEEERRGICFFDFRGAQKQISHFVRNDSGRDHKPILRNSYIPRPITLTTILILALCVSSCFAASSNPLSQHECKSNKIVVVVANRLTLDDLDNPSLPAITKMIQKGAIGLVSPNCAKGKSELSCMLTAGAGASCRGGGFIRDFYDTDEVLDYGQQALESYTRQTGYNASPGSAVFLGLGPALRANMELAKPARLGALGDALHESGKKTASTGNADIAPKRTNRSVAVLAMDSHGRIDIGGLNRTLDLSAIDKADFTVIDFGETVRLDDLKISMTDKAFESHKSSAMSSLDNLIGRLMRSKAIVILVSFGLPSGDKWNRLTPIVVYGPNISGLLTTPTTRTPGLIAASDFAPTVLGLFGIPALPEMMGRAAEVMSSANNLSAARELDTRVHTHQVIVEPVIYVIMTVGTITFILAIIAVIFSLRARRKICKVVRVGLVTAWASSIAMLLAVLAPVEVKPQLAALSVLWIAIVVASFLIGNAINRASGLRAVPLMVVFALGSAAIIIDAITGGGLCRFALPSQFQMSGYRYYGIGNEYAGILIGMSALLSIFSGDNIRRWLTPALGIIVILTLGIGRIGANYGATMAAAITFGLVYLSIKRGRFGFRHIIAVSAAGAAVLAVLSVVDYKLFGSTAAHAGRMAGFIQRAGIDYALLLILRKAALNLRIIIRPEAMIAYAVLVPTYLFWTYKVPERIKDAIFSDNRAAAGVKALLIGMLAALLLNDSGIVMALLMFGMLASLLLYFVIESIGAKGEVK